MIAFDEGLEVLESRTRWVGLLILAYIAATLATVGVQVGEITGALDMSAPDPGLGGLLAAGVYLAFIVVFCVTVVLVGMWIYRAHANVRAAGAGPLEVSPGWAVGWFFIPIANLFKPFQAMRELWNASHNASDGYTQESDPKLALWWGFWIVSNILSNLSVKPMFTGGATGQSAATMVDVVGGLLSIPAAWFLLLIVREVNSAQRSTMGAASTFA